MRAAMLVTRIPPGTLEPILKKTFAELDPNLTVISVRTMEEQVALSFGRQRAVASLAGLFGIVALLLAAVGMYGVTAYSVARRTAEIGIRMALGADRAAVVRMVLTGASTGAVVSVFYILWNRKRFPQKQPRSRRHGYQPPGENRDRSKSAAGSGEWH